MKYQVLALNSWIYKMSIKINSIIFGIIAIFLVKISIENIQPQKTASEENINIDRSYAGQNSIDPKRKDT